MIKFDEWWLPDGEKHLQQWMHDIGLRVDGRLTYQYSKYEAALKFCRGTRNCCDVGAHVGLFSYWMARDFDHVDAFEPIAEHRECFVRNLNGDRFIKKVLLHEFALGKKHRKVSFRTPEGSSGGTHIAGPGDIEMRPLDSFGLADVDFMKIDCEGYELQVCQGAEKLLRACRPCVMVEQKSHTPGGREHIAPGKSAIPAVDFLASLGAEVRAVLSGDYILSWE